MWDGEWVNQQLRGSKVVDMETEEQIYDYLFNKDKTAVFLMIYNPGHFLSENFNKTFEIESKKYE